MTSPLTLPQSDSVNPLGQPNAAAGPSRSPHPTMPSLPAFNAGNNMADSMTDPQLLQARLAAAQQAMLGLQQQQQLNGSQSGDLGGMNGNGGLNMANAAGSLGGTPGVSNDQMLRQLQVMQAHVRRNQQNSSLNFPSPANSTASPSNSTSQFPNPGTPSSATNAPSPSVNGTVLNSTGTGPSITPIQLTQQQKELWAQQQHARMRTNSNDHSSPLNLTNPGLPSTLTAAQVRPPPGGPGGPGGVSQQRKQFVQSLGAYYKSQNQPLPPLIFNGERDGEVKVAGCWVDMFELFMVIMRAQGVANAIKQPPESETWKRLFATSKLPSPLPEALPIPLPPSVASESNSFPTTNPVQYLVGLYVAYIKGFEDQMQKHRQQLMQRQQAAQAALSAGRPPSIRPASTGTPRPPMANIAATQRGASGPSVSTPTQSAPTPTGIPAASTPSALASQPIASTPASQPSNTPLPQSAQTPSTIAPAPSTLTPATQTTQMPAMTPATVAPTPPASSMFTPTPIGMGQANGNSTGTSSVGTSQTRKPTPIPKPIDTTSAGDMTRDSSISTPSSAKRKTLEDENASAEQTPQQEKSPKRQRYKVEYKPIHVPMTNLAGWDERAVRSTFPKNNMAHPTHSIHELGVVDMEAILMGLRSRLPRELGYAITVLSMLSMPHPEDALDGLPLVHIKDIYAELLALLEETAFGEDGYDAWLDRIQGREDVPQIDLSSIDFLEYEQIGRHDDITLAEDIMQEGKWRKDRTGGSTDIILSLVNLIRNFSLYDENQSFMGRHPATFTVLSRIIDYRLARVPGWCSESEPFSIIEYHSVCRDVILILTNIGKHVSLSSIPSSSSLSIFRFISRILASGLDVSNWRDTPFGGMVSAKECPVPIVTTLYRATEAFYCLAGSDQNREVLGRTIPESELVKLFDSLVKLLPNTSRAVESLYTTEGSLIQAECTALALYSLTFLSPLSSRAIMRSMPGGAPTLRRLVTNLMSRPAPYGKSPYSVLCRRLSETLGVLNGTVTCTGESGDVTKMGFSAGSGDGKGWRWASGIVEGGWMASCGEMISECLTAPEVDKHTFAELDALWWARGD